jgi:glycosyltransferase involved in cell wall biosynthesis
MNKTLLICDLYPIPENIGSNMRTMNLVRFFQSYGSVDIAYTTVDVSYTAALADAEGKKQIFSREYILRKKDYPKSFISRFFMLVKGVPYPIREYDDASHEKIISLLESSEYDYVIVRYIQNTISLIKLPGHLKSKIIVDFDDIITHSLYEVFFYSTNSLFKKFTRNLNKILLSYYQKQCLRFGASLFCSEGDRSELSKRHIKKNTFVVPNTYDNNLFKDYDFGDGACNGHTLLFVGTLLYRPNIRGLMWFITSVYNDYKAQYPDAKLLVVGRSPTSEIANLCYGTDGVELYQDVPDVKVYYKQCKAVVIPLLEGGGTRIKILEAALANRPILSTPQGVEGLDLYDDEDILQFRDKSGFLTAYEKLLSREKYNSLVHNARECVLTKYSTESLNSAMERVLHTIDNNRQSKIKSDEYHQPSISKY